MTNDEKDTTMKYDGEYPVPKNWSREHEGEEASFDYVMSLEDIYECGDIDGMNDFLDSVLGTLIISDISYEIVDHRDDSVMIRATGTVEQF